MTRLDKLRARIGKVRSKRHAGAILASFAGPERAAAEAILAGVQSKLVSPVLGPVAVIPANQATRAHLKPGTVIEGLKRREQRR